MFDSFFLIAKIHIAIIKILQQLWDYAFIVRTSIEDWKKTPWRKIDVENMDIECKKFAKDIRLLDKEMRGWDTYLMLESTVKNMLTSLRAVGELQNPAIRERHWIQLMASTKVFTAIQKLILCFLLLFSHKMSVIFILLELPNALYIKKFQNTIT